MKYTKNLKLSKPDYADDVDVQVINNNMDILDDKIGDLPYLPLGGGTMKGNINFANKWNGITYGRTCKIDLGPSGWLGQDKETISFYGELFKFYVKPSSTVVLIDSDNIYHKGRKVLFDGGTNTALNGYTKLSNGLIMQWGALDTDENTGYGDVGVVTLPQPMATSAYTTYITKSYGTGDQIDNSWDWRCATMNTTTTGFKIKLDGHDTSRQIHWLVIGKGV